MTSLAQKWKNEGIKEGVEKGIEKVAKKTLLRGHSTQEVIDITDLTTQEIENLRKN